MTQRRTQHVEDPIDEVRITDPYIVGLVAREQQRTGEKVASRVAARLITERLAIREVMPESEHATTAA